MELITVQCEEKGAAVISLRGRQIHCAIPELIGEEAVSPVDMMVSSLGACIGIMVDGYCRSHGYLDGRATVCLTQQMGGEPRRVTGITIDVELPRDFPVGKRDIINRLVEKCPVHSTLLHPPQIDLEIL